MGGAVEAIDHGTMSIASPRTEPTVSDVPRPDSLSGPESGASTLISARGVEKTYRTGDVVVHALRGVDLDIASGEFVVVMGPSGNGKSTLLNCLSGIDEIDGGSVEIDGHDIHAMSDRARTTHRAKRMGFVFQSFNLIPVLSAVENVELPMLAGGAKPKESRAKAMDLLGRVGLADRGSHRPAELSGGEQQRVAVARALVTDPAVVWADEPTGNLDSATAGSVLELFHEVNRAGQTMVVVTHDPTIGASADRLVEVRDGLVSSDRRQRGTSAPASSAPDNSVPAPESLENGTTR